MKATAFEPNGIRVKNEDSPLGRWTTAHWFPPVRSQLSGIVDRVWYFEGTMTHRRERVFPDGLAELIVMLDEPHRDGDANGLVPFPALCINGLRTHPSLVVSPPGRCRVLGIRFQPKGACLVLRSSMKEFVDVTVDLRDATGRAASELGERCAAAADKAPTARHTAAAVVATAVSWTLQRTGGIDADPAIDWTASVIRNSRGTAPLDAIASQLSLQRSRLAQRFSDGLGLVPKRYARIVRFHAALSVLGRTESIATAAAELEYYDQAHMYRDFAEFAGMTPGDFLAGRRYPGTASLAES
jgi:AraC-like DNA-binding protein